MLPAKIWFYLLIVWAFTTGLTASSMGQQDGVNASHKGLTPAQQAYRQWVAHRRALQADGKRIMAELGQNELAGDCKQASTTVDFDACFGRLADAANQTLNQFEEIVRALQSGPPQTPEQAAQSKAAAEMPGIAGPVLTPTQFAAEFEHVEQAWKQYRETACRAAFHQFSGGTGGASFELECRLKLTRHHLHELDMIYGEELHL